MLTRDSVQNSSRSLGRILAVDDNIDSAESLGVLLGFLGAEARTAYDGVAALEYIKSWQPRVVIMDLGMPGIDGYEAARRIRRDSRNANIVLIALTGRGEEEARQKSHDAGFDFHILKPVNLDALEELLASIQD